MSKSQAFDFVCHRAKAMHNSAQQNKGSMFAVLKLADEKVEEICNSLPGAYPVNYNSPGQVVVACAENTTEKLQEAVKENSGKSIKLAVSGAFHSPFMNAASDSVAGYLIKENLSAIEIPLYSNTTAQEYNISNAKELLAKQINHPVLWQKTIENMITNGFDTFIEVGPGKTLSGLIKKINTDVIVHNVSDLETLEKTVSELRRNNA